MVPEIPRQAVFGLPFLSKRIAATGRHLLAYERKCIEPIAVVPALPPHNAFELAMYANHTHRMSLQWNKRPVPGRFVDIEDSTQLLLYIGGNRLHEYPDEARFSDVLVMCTELLLSREIEIDYGSMDSAVEAYAQLSRTD